MEAILKFNLDKPDELDMYNRVVDFLENDLTIDPIEKLRKIKSTDMALALSDIIYKSKKELDWEIEMLADEYTILSSDEVLDKVYKKISEILDNRGLIIDDLIE